MTNIVILLILVLLMLSTKKGKTSPELTYGAINSSVKDFDLSCRWLGFCNCILLLSVHIYFSPGREE